MESVNLTLCSGFSFRYFTTKIQIYAHNVAPTPFLSSNSASSSFVSCVGFVYFIRVYKACFLKYTTHFVCKLSTQLKGRLYVYIYYLLLQLLGRIFFFIYFLLVYSCSYPLLFYLHQVHSENVTICLAAKRQMVAAAEL